MEFKHDVFVSYASQDRKFVTRLATALEEYGLSVWFDEFELVAGDSIRRVIDEGIQNSEFGVVVLSDSFFSREWPQKELDALVSKEEGGKKVIIPVWHNVDASSVRKYAPLLASKLSIYSNAPIVNIARRIVTAVHRERISQGVEWSPIIIELPNNTSAAVLPVCP